MPRAIGPFDGRIRRTRCSACIKGHLKCEGGIPCKNCLRTEQACTAPSVAKPVVLFEPINRASKSVPFRSRNSNIILASITSDAASRYVTHFNTAFLCSNSLTGSSADQFQDVMPLLHNCPALQHAVMAVSVLDIEKRVSRTRYTAGRTALQYYKAGISSLQADLVDANLSTNTSVLWSTFFLGMFELMCDGTGEGWVKHFLHGTSALLQYRGPPAHLDGPGRRFFLTARIFEISRALIYSSESFLAENEWRLLMKSIWSGDGAKDWHPKEALFDLMLSCSTLSIRAIRCVHEVQASGEELDEAEFHSLAEEGFSLRWELSSWSQMAQAWSTRVAKRQSDMQMSLALIYHHAISIYLSGIFDYHRYWIDRQIQVPNLSASEIQAHTRAILDVVGSSLKQGTLAGILFFFPLRVAGARAQNLEQRREISRMLHMVSQRGFVVAEAFMTDLEDLWTEK